MAERPRPIAKLTRPSVGDLLKRERLFEALDAAAAGKAAWLAAPGGAGKTSLIATWLEARGLRALWYSLDAGDSDLASFFYYFSTAAKQDFGVTDLPPYVDGQPVTPRVFAQRFFELLFAASEPPEVVVLDDYQELAPDAPVHEAIDALLRSAPPGFLVVIASRTEPPPPLARWTASAEMRWIDWPALQFTREETAALASMRGVRTAGLLDALHDLTRGWAAAVVVLARMVTRGMRLPRPGETPTAVFDFFAREIFADVAPESREFLLRTSFLPGMTAAMARSVSGDARAGELLEEFHRGHLFTERKEGEEIVYEYHPMFREFLQAQARLAFDADTLRGVRRTAADVLAALGQLDDAVPLLAANEDWRALARLLRIHGRKLAVSGRHKRLATWLEAVPDVVLDQEPWLAFWLGWCRMAEGRAGWRTLLIRASDGFERTGDIEGAFTSRAWLLRTSMATEEAEGWIAAIEQLAAAHPQFDDPETEALIISQFRLVQQFPPHHPLIERWAARAETLVRGLEDIGLRLLMAAYALGVHLTHGDLRRMSVLVSETEALQNQPGAPPSELVTFLLVRGLYHLQFGDIESAEANLSRMERLADATGSVFDFVSAWHFGCRVALLAGDPARARGYHTRLQQIGNVLPPYTQHGGTNTVLLQLLEHDLDGAFGAASAVLQAGNLFPVFRPLWQANYAQVLLARGEGGAASAVLDQTIAEARTSGLPATECAALLLRAAAMLRIGDVMSAYASLREGLAAAREMGCVPQSPPMLPAMLAELIAAALEHGIEREFAGEIARQWRLVAPSSEEERWPWPVRVRVLGAFEIAVEGRGLKGAIKTQRRPMELLKCLIAFGGRDVNVTALMQALWPGALGDAAKRSFDITLHRLRRALGGEHTVLLEGRKLALNHGIVWVDAFAFERLATHAENAFRAARAVMPADSMGAPLPAFGSHAVFELHDRALRLYRGPFLASDDDAWVLPVRERLRGRYLRLVENAGELLERAVRFEAALHCYERAVELDPPAERIYRRLMRSLHAQGRSAEALDVYRRCTRVLKATLGAGPSPETEALIKKVRGR